MHSLEEKNHLSNELERCKKKLEDANQQKARIEERLVAALTELKQIKRYNVLSLHLKVEVMKELQKARLEVENVRRQMLQQEISFNIQQTEALTRYEGDFSFQISLQSPVLQT